MRSLLKVLGQSKRLTPIVAFGGAGVLLTSTWAAGVASSPGANSVNSASAPLVAGAPDNNTDRFDGTVALGPDGAAGLTVNFSGRWGVLPDTAANPTVHYELFDIDLSDAQFDTGNYFVEIGLLATPVPANFTVLQVDWVIDDEACASADFTGFDAAYTAALAADPDDIQPGEVVADRVLFADNLDNSVIFPNLTDALSESYCVGVEATGVLLAADPAGTFVRRVDTSAVTMPSFVAIVNQHT